MKIREIIDHLEKLAPPTLQETYDNVGLLTGDAEAVCTGVICSLDCTEEVVEEAIQKKCNLIVAHHPIVFSGLKKITGRNYVERTVIKAIKNEIAIYAIHTNLDNVLTGVNGTIGKKLGLQKCKVLAPKTGWLKKLITFVPEEHAEAVRNALFAAGAGDVGNYSECSFSINGEGSFKAGDNTNPFVGEKGVRHIEKETRVEFLYPAHAEAEILKALFASHPYEEVAYDLVPLENLSPEIGSGLIGELKEPMGEIEFLTLLKQVFGLQTLRHSSFTGKKVKKVAVCGGAGSFLISNALGAKADAFVTSDLKYHEFFDADSKLLLADIGHYESEQFTIDLLQEEIAKKFPTFAVLKTTEKTNPVRYFLE
jgi:dinuclear metal center YbgI/SA1388 family protein